MPTEKPRVTITMSKERLEELETYRFDNKFKNQTQAILSLIEKGLESFESDKPPLRYSLEAEKLAKDYDALDSHGKKLLRIVADEELDRMKTEATKELQAMPIIEVAEEIDIDREVELYRQALIQEKKAAEESFALPNSKEA